MVTLGAPHKGVGSVPHCFYGYICDAINSVAKSLVYYPLVQDWCGPCGYFRDPDALEDYLYYSAFLPSLNNERDSKVKKENAERFSELNKALLIKFSEDSMVFPPESAWFWELQSDNTVLPIEKTDFYSTN